MKRTLLVNLHDSRHRHHLVLAILLCGVEIGVILHVEAVIIHLIASLGVFSREFVEILLTD